LLGRGGHPVEAVFGEGLHPVRPAPCVEQDSLAREQQLDLAQQARVDVDAVGHVADRALAAAAHVVGCDRFGAGERLHRFNDDTAAQGLFDFRL
jgi:hypothetical protein